MKKFKAVYYSVLSVLTVLMLVLGLVAASNPYAAAGGVSNEFTSNVKTHLNTIASANHSSTDENASLRVRNYIKNQLKEAGVAEQSEFTEDKDDLYGQVVNCDFVTDGGKPVATYFVQNDILTQETVEKINSMRGGDELIATVEREVENIIVVIPGTGTASGTAGDALVMTAHYDSFYGSNGASDNGVSVAAMLETIKTIAGGTKTFKNDLVFVFTDAENDGAYGAYAFRYQFKGFMDVYSRAKLGINFNGMGTDGAIALFEETENVKLVAQFNKKVSGVITDSAFGYIYSQNAETSDFAIFDNIEALNLSNVGNNVNTSLDTVSKVSKSAIKAKSNLINGVVSAFGSFELDSIKEGDNGVYFSYLGLFNVTYSYTAAYVIAALILVLLVGAIVLNIFKKSFSIINLLCGIGIQISTLVSAGLLTLGVYFLSVLLMVGFGVLPFNAMTSLSYINAGVIIGGMMLFFAAAAAFYYIYKRTFRIKSADIVRGSAVLFALVGAICSFAMPQISHIFAIAGLLEMIVFLVTVLVKDKFRAKFGMDIERLFLYAIPMVLVAFPMFVTLTALAMKLIPTVWLCAFLVAFGAMLGVIVPYFDFAIPSLNKLMAKLPQRTIRVERTVEEKVEDKAKKGKFTVQKVKKVTNEKIDWRYNHAVALSAVTVIAMVVIILCSSFSTGFGTAYTGSFPAADSIYKDSLLYVWERNETDITETVEIHDHMAYKYMSKAIDEMKWNDEKNAYVKEFNGETSNILKNQPRIEVVDGKIVFTPYNGAVYSKITVRLLDASDITKVTVSNAADEEFVINNEEKKDVIVIDIPYASYNYNIFRIAVESKYSNHSVEYEQHVLGGQANNTLQNNLDEWLQIKNYFDEDGIYNLMRTAMVLKYTKSVSI